MNRWIILAQERFPILWIAALVCGISLSGIALGGNKFGILPFALSFIGIAFYFAMMRLIVEVRDVEKDRIAHPERPLARGLISKREAVLMIDLLLMLFVSYGLIVWVLLQATAALLFLTVVIYLWLAHKGFYMGNKIERHPLFKRVLYLIGIFPVAFFAVAAANPAPSLLPMSWSFGVFLFGAMGCYEICTKLDPHAHPILGTLVQFFGFQKVYYMIAFLLILSGMQSFALGVAPLAIPVELLVLAAVSVLFFQQALFKIPDLVSSFSLMVHAWAVALFSL